MDCKEFHKNLYKLYRSDEDTYDIVYAAVKTASNVSNKKANYITNEIIDKVSSLSNENFLNDANACTQQIIDNFFSSYTDNLDDDTRYFFLHQLKFGLSVYTSDEAVRRIEDGENLTELFENYYAEYGNADVFSESYLKNEIKELIANHCISPLCMKRLTENLNADNVLERSVKTGENAQRLICIIAAYIYSATDGEISPDKLISFINICTHEIEHFNYAISRSDEINLHAHQTQNLLFFGGLIFTVVASIVLLLMQIHPFIVFGVFVVLLTVSFKVPPMVKNHIKYKEFIKTAADRDETTLALEKCFDISEDEDEDEYEDETEDIVYT